MKKFFFFIAFIAIVNVAKAQTATTHETITREANYIIEFPDSAPLPLHVKCEYDDSKTDDNYYTIFLNNEKDASFTLNKLLSFDVFVEKFTTKCRSIFPNRKAPTIITLYKVYQLIWSIKNPTGDAPEAGVLRFSRALLIFGIKSEENEKLSYIQRREKSDSISNSLTDLNAKAKYLQERLETELKKDTSSLGKKIELFTAMLRNERPAAARNDDEFIAFRFTLDEIKQRYFLRSITRESIKELMKTDTAADSAKKYDYDFRQNLSEVIRVLKSHKEKISDALANNIDAFPANVLYSRLRNPDNDADEKNDTLRYKSYDSIGINLVSERDTALKKLNRESAKYTPTVQSIKDSLYRPSKINKIELQFERGFIEAVKVWLTVGSSEYIFENIYAIGFSSVSNYRRISNTKLFVRNSPDDIDGWYIYLSDIFRNYDNRLNNFTRDYSPADTAFTIIPAEIPEIVLRKEKYINIIDARLYADLKGIDRSKPEGLLQIELSKRFNINTARVQTGTKRSDFGFFNYFDLFASLTKIEQNNRELTLKNANIRDVNNSLISPYYATNLDFMRYQNYGVGVNVGIMLFDKPDYKFTAYLDFGIKYGHTLIADSVLLRSGDRIKPFGDKNLEAHFITYQFPKISIEFFPESRITPKISWQLNNTKLFSNNQYKQVMSYEKSDVTSFFPMERKAAFSNQYEIFVKVAPDKNRSSHVFARWRFYTQFGDANTSFSQLQIGYAYNWTITR